MLSLLKLSRICYAIVVIIRKPCRTLFQPCKDAVRRYQRRAAQNPLTVLIICPDESQTIPIPREPTAPRARLKFVVKAPSPFEAVGNGVLGERVLGHVEVFDQGPYEVSGVGRADRDAAQRATIDTEGLIRGRALPLHSCGREERVEPGLKAIETHDVPARRETKTEVRIAL